MIHATTEVVANHATYTGAFLVFLQWFLGVFGSIIVVLVTAITKKVLVKAHIGANKEVLSLAQNFAQIAVNKTEAWANQQTGKIPSNDKLKHSVDIAIKLASETKITDFMKNHAEELIENYLQEKDLFKKS
jgi:hypothetical protein